MNDGQTEDVPGTGLGLYIAKDLTELLGGRIWAESRKGQGTNIYFTVPAMPRKNVSGVEKIPATDSTEPLEQRAGS